MSQFANRNRQRSAKIKKMNFWYIVPVFVIISFILTYGSWLLSSHSFIHRANGFFTELGGRTGPFLAQTIIFGIILALLQIRFKTSWKSSGIFVAFIISLFGEMFGAALFVYTFSTRFFTYPSWESRGGFLYRGTLAHQITHTVGAWVVFLSLVLIAVAWYQLYHNRGDIVVSGIYSRVRHPQYLGFIGFTFGWLIYWPTLLNLFIWPLLVAAYVRQAFREEEYLSEIYGEMFFQYKLRTGMFFPKIKIWGDRN